MAERTDARVLAGSGWEGLAKRGFDAPKLFSAYMHTLRWNCVTATDAKLFQVPFRAGIKLDAYQIEPLRKALLLPRVNLFIADDVGLGKTIEAGLVARELMLRKKVRDIVVACTPSVLPQWRMELEQRFGLAFEVLDHDYVGRIRRERGYATNPWSTHSLFLISHRLLIDEDYTAPLRDWLGELRPGSLLTRCYRKSFAGLVIAFIGHNLDKLLLTAPVDDIGQVVHLRLHVLAGGPHLEPRILYLADKAALPIRVRRKRDFQRLEVRRLCPTSVAMSGRDRPKRPLVVAGAEQDL